MAFQIGSFKEMKNQVGREIGLTDWLQIDQDQLNQFTQTTTGLSRTPDVDTASDKISFGKTMGHDYLAVSLLYYFLGNHLTLSKGTTMINYGMNKVRLLAPVHVNAKIRDQIFFTHVEEKASGILTTTSHRIEIKGQEKPALTAEILTLFLAP